MPQANATKTLVTNKRANFDYAFSEKLTAGLVLSGAETKSLKSGQASLAGAYVTIRGQEAFLSHAYISPYKYAGKDIGNPERERKLLLKREEISSLLGKEKGLVIIPIAIFEGSRGFIKISIGVGKPKKKYDKRESIKQKDIKKRIRAGVDN